VRTTLVLTYDTLPSSGKVTQGQARDPLFRHGQLPSSTGIEASRIKRRRTVVWTGCVNSRHL